jgi:hypothetical protein
VPRRCGFRSGGCSDFPTIPFSVAAHSTAAQFSIPPPAASKTTDAARDPSSRQRGHREGADKEGILAAMKALWRELADPKIKEHHGPVVKTTRLAAIESRKGRLSSSVAPKRSGPSGPGAGTCFQPGYPRLLGTAPAYILCCGLPSND